MFNTVCNGGLHIKEYLCLTQFVMMGYTYRNVGLLTYCRKVII